MAFRQSVKMFLFFFCMGGTSGNNRGAILFSFLTHGSSTFLTGEAKPRKSLVVGQSGVSKICEQTSVSSKCV